MKIIEHGNVVGFKGVCTRCGCVFEATVDEVNFWTHDSMVSKITFANCNCPECGWETDMLPVTIQEPEFD